MDSAHADSHSPSLPLEANDNTPGGAAAAMELIAELEDRLERTQAEKDRLQKDVDELCKQQVGQGLLGVAFGSSDAVARIHARRVSSLEDQIRGWKAQTQELTKQAAEMQAEIRELHRAKNTAQQALRDAEEHARLARADVAHFQNQVATALGQRDDALLEADLAKGRCEKALGECERALEERDRVAKDLAELKAEVGRFLHEGGGDVTRGAEETVCVECRKEPSGVETIKKEEIENAKGLPEQSGEENRLTSREGLSDEEEPEGSEVSGEVGSVEGDPNAASLDAQEGTSAESKPTDGHEAERRAMQERVEILEAQLRLVIEEREGLKRALEAGRRRIENDGGRFDDGSVSKSGTEAALQRGETERQTERNNDEGDTAARSSRVGSLQGEPDSGIRSELERGEGNGGLVQGVPRVDVLDSDVTLLGASSALQAQLSQLLNDPGVVSLADESAERMITSRESPENATTANFESPPHLGPSFGGHSLPSRTEPLTTGTGLDNSAKTLDGAFNVPGISGTAEPEKQPDPANSNTEPFPKPGDDFDVRRALAQAAQEKVAALVLLSQQEERHEMEARQTLNLHARLGEAQERLADVVREKVAALMEVAQLREEVESLKDSERRLSALIQQQQGGSSLSSRLLPAVWSKPPAAKESATESARGPSAASPAVSPSPSAISLEEQERAGPVPASPSSWFATKPASPPASRRPSGNGTRTGTGTGTEPPQKKPNWYRGWIPRAGDSSKSPAKSDGWSSGDEGGGDVARLRVENAALHERVATVERLTASAHKLRTRLSAALTEVVDARSLSPAESRTHVRTALETVKAVAAEAGQLKIALGGSLPVSYSQEGGDSASENETGGRGGTGAHDAVDTATAAGLEMAELIVAAAELQRAVLQKRLGEDEGQSNGLLA